LGDNALAQPADSRDGSILETPMLLAWKIEWMISSLQIPSQTLMLLSFIQYQIEVVIY
jgi:hypothetical protein